MSDSIEDMDHTTELCNTNDIGVDEVYDELEKLIDSVDAEERELKVGTYLFLYYYLFKLIMTN